MSSSPSRRVLGTSCPTSHKASSTAQSHNCPTLGIAVGAGLLHVAPKLAQALLPRFPCEERAPPSRLGTSPGSFDPDMKIGGGGESGLSRRLEGFAYEVAHCKGKPHCMEKSCIIGGASTVACVGGGGGGLGFRLEAIAPCCDLLLE